MNKEIKVALASLIAGCGFSFAATNASAAIACNGAGDCWHTHGEYVVRPEFGVTVHPDGWTWKEGEKHKWREHEGHGYWHGDSWKEF
jgi:hypothetical protein